ncbi:CoA pyrophosphatase [Luminiphilus sp.]|nr:CoA pyrophosphatase [Luminiphilus sp.]
MKALIQPLQQHLAQFNKEPAGFEPQAGRAAVAIILREGGEATEMLMIRRAIRDGDPWSGHMGFPGGRRDPSDQSNLGCALRETEEELGVDLVHCATQLGELTDVNTGWRADRPEMLVTPFVFQVNDVPVMSPNDEVDEVVWIPLHLLMQLDQREPMAWEWKGQKMESDSYLYASYRIWGLSLMMIDEMLALLRPS